MSKKCPMCGRGVGVYQDYVGGTSFFRCDICGHTGCDFEDVTLFDRITASPEVLAEKLVYCVPVPLFEIGAGLERWYTVFSPFDAKKYFRTKGEATAEAVEKLKEVNNVRLES